MPDMLRRLKLLTEETAGQPAHQLDDDMKFPRCNFRGCFRP
jgi:hypothetical protein